MEAKDTVMNKEKLKQINDAMPPEAKYGDVFETIAYNQAEISFPLGEQQGIEKVVEWMEEHSIITYGRAPLKIKWQSINPVAWQAFLKERGI